MQSMETAIDNMIEEIKKPVDPEINGSARKSGTPIYKTNGYGLQGAYYREAEVGSDG